MCRLLFGRLELFPTLPSAAKDPTAAEGGVQVSPNEKEQLRKPESFSVPSNHQLEGGCCEPSGSAIFSQFFESGLGRDATCCLPHSVSLSFVTEELLLVLQLQPTNPARGQGGSWGGNLVLRGNHAVCFLPVPAALQ